MIDTKKDITLRVAVPCGGYGYGERKQVAYSTLDKFVKIYCEHGLTATFYSKDVGLSGAACVTLYQLDLIRPTGECRHAFIPYDGDDLFRRVSAQEWRICCNRRKAEEIAGLLNEYSAAIMEMLGED